VSSQVRLHWIVVVLIHGFEFSRTIHARGKEWQARLEVEGRWPLTDPGLVNKAEKVLVRLQLEQLSDSGCRTLLTGGRTDVPHKDM
jgi:hypothetical protein